ncbi:hypothetical protein MRQ36_30530 [Micromonospora sp. R77]|uniref:hypothetical protein n=1 Tax=Micromonospora sp. R77 TaxID=2925836 RepID=UPI001F615172|nr:hypothetical protein [Micromonospora sp. R77]MCI4066664.1 hypothetical protein [Micromonospora sp. R77]
MALYIDVGFGNSDQVFADFTSLTGGTGDLGEVNVSGFSDIVRLTYTSPGTDAVSQRIKALVDVDGDIVVSGVPSSFVLPDGNVITAVAGETFTDTTSAGDSVVRVAYDVGLCNGSGYWVDGQSGSHVDMPRAIILYHELSHAWHIVTGTVAGTSAAEEQAAETDENVARSAKGEDLRLTTSHNGGCGSPGSSSGDWQIDCFVVTAAMGADAQKAVDALRLVRDLAVRVLPVGYALFEDLYREYYSYSPGIARRLWLDPALRDAYREAVVEPLLTVYAVLLRALRAWPDVAAVDAALADALATAVGAGPLRDPLAAQLVDVVLDRGPRDGPVGAGLVDDRLPLTQWAIIRPVRTYWRLRLGGWTPEPAALRANIVAWWLEQAPDLTVTPDALRHRVGLVEETLLGGSSAWQQR